MKNKSGQLKSTPETDAVEFQIAGSNHFAVHVIYARKLERERDEAREERDIARLECEEISNELNDARKERDELREENARLRDITERAINYLDQSYRNGFSDEASDLRYELAQIKEAAK